ncbi:cardiolipin synthase [Glaesserella sp.]|uniref:cardiolipin synthase n=1 Tax=Glaesserella sp. TaxID=2094731 RepID=UPI0035A11B2E
MTTTFAQVISIISPLFFWFAIASATVRLLIKKQSNSATLSWIMLIYLVPIIGLILYLMFGEITLGRKHAEKAKALAPIYQEWFKQLQKHPHLLRQNISGRYLALFELCQKQLQIPCVAGNELKLLSSPQTIMRQIIRDIRNAETEIRMVFYIWHNGGMVDDIAEELKNARRRGVNVQVLLDAVGSSEFLRSPQYHAMRAEGIEIGESFKVKLWRVFLSRIDLRQHRKIIVIDNHIGYTGSMNMVDPAFFKQDENVGQWIDVMVRINGPVSTVLAALHSWDWQIENEVEALPPLPDEKHVPVDLDNQHAVQILPSGPNENKELMPRALATAIYSARSSIVITTPYFVPSLEIANALESAALRGVSVKIIVPKRNDSVMVEWASRYFFDELLEAGVEIYRFEDGLLHTKSILIDERLVMIGSVNMDIRSFLLNFEVTMIVDDADFAREVNTLQRDYIDASTMVDVERWAKRPVYKRIVEKLFYLSSPLL